MTLTQGQVIEAMTQLNSTIERYYARTAVFLVFGFISGFLMGAGIMLMMLR